MNGRSPAAIPLIEQQNALQEKQGDKKNLAIGLGNLAENQIKIGRLQAAEANLRRRIALCQELEDKFNEAIGHQQLGWLLGLQGQGAAANDAFDASINYWDETDDYQGLSLTWAHRAWVGLLAGSDSIASATHAAQQALHFAQETARTQYPYERDFIRAHWLLGWAALAAHDLATAQQELDTALRRCRAINLVELEPAILLAHARLAWAQGKRNQAAQFAQEAFNIAQRASYRLNLADSHNFLAQLALDAGDLPRAAQHANQAHTAALCDGPPHVYKSALDEATRLRAILADS